MSRSRSSKWKEGLHTHNAWLRLRINIYNIYYKSLWVSVLTQYYILYGEQSRGECIILLSAYNKIIHGVVPLTLPLCCHATALVEKARLHRPHYTSVRIRSRSRFRPDKCEPFYTAPEAAFSPSIPHDHPLTTTHNIRLEKSIDVITRGRGALATPRRQTRAISFRPVNSTPFRSTRRVNATRRSPLLSPHLTIHNSITCFFLNNNIIMSNNNNNDNAKRRYTILWGENR